jgi:hypothetical protein
MELFKTKLEVENMISERKNLKENKKYKLLEDNKVLGNFGIYIPDLMQQLWENPKSMATILLKADKNDVKKNLAHFVVHNLYDNISSLRHKDDQLIYIISLLLKEDINSLNDINSSFNLGKRAPILFDELNKKNEIKFFFKTIILDAIKKLESTYSSTNVIFEPGMINQKIEEHIKMLDKKDEQNNICDKNFNKTLDEKDKKIMDKYLYLPINKDELNKKLKEYEDKENKEMIDFIQNIISECTTNPDKYTNKIILEKINNNLRSGFIMNYYQVGFLQIIDIINIIFENLLNNSGLLPYSIKCICKIISILIQKKFPDAKKVERNNFLVSFFFMNLFFPILVNPSLNTFTNEVIITNSSIEKFQLIMTILNNITLGKLFVNSFYSPFNWYIIEKMPQLFKFLDDICEVSLPPFIDKLINDELPEDYQYDYFVENPEETILFRSICYNINELYSLVTNAEKFKDDIILDKKVIGKFTHNIRKLENLKNSLNSQNKSNNNSSNYFIYIDLINNKKYDNIFKIKKKNNTKSYFNLEELKVIETIEEKEQNQIIKIKNFFFALLYNYPIISKTEFNKEKMNDILNILNELKNNSYLNSSVYMENKSIPLNWYINSLIQYLPLMTEIYKENNYEKFLNDIEEEIISSINKLDFGQLSSLIEHMKELEKERFYYENIKSIINDIDINKKADIIIQNEQISLNLEKDNNNLNQYFSKLVKNNEFKYLFSKSKKNKYFNTIKSFLYNFPNISNDNKNYESDYFQLLENKKIPEIIEKYSILIKNNLKEKTMESEEDLNEICNKIYDYIMEQLYDKLYPKQKNEIDVEINKNCCKHIWIDISNLINQKKNFIFDNFLPESISYLKNFEKEKSPRKKLYNIKKLFNSIYNLGEFNSKDVEGADDELPLLNYSFIKSMPENIYSNCRYTELFIGNQQFGIEGSQLTKMLGICEKMKNLSYEELFNINPSDYKTFCDLSESKILY